MADRATPVERVQRRLRRHLQRHPDSRLRGLRRALLDTAARRDASLCGSPYCSCADTMPACPHWEGTDNWPENGCPRCGAPREHHDDQKITEETS